jgi:hypothetical protein
MENSGMALWGDEVSRFVRMGTLNSMNLMLAKPTLYNILSLCFLIPPHL